MNDELVKQLLDRVESLERQVAALIAMSAPPRCQTAIPVVSSLAVPGQWEPVFDTPLPHAVWCGLGGASQ